MYISSFNRKSKEYTNRDINKETDLFLFTDFYEALGKIPYETLFDSEGNPRYFGTGTIVEIGIMSMDFEIEDLCETAKEALQGSLDNIAKFLEVEPSSIDCFSFIFE